MLDELAARTNLSHLISVGAHCVTLSGSFGEFPLLSEAERIRLFEVATEEAAGRCSIIAHTGAFDTATAVRLSQAAEKIGVDGLLINPPPFHGPVERDILDHYTQCSNSTTLPIIIYNNMWAGVNLSQSIILELSHFDNVVLVKQSSNDFYDLLETIRLTKGRDDFFVTNGKEIRAFPGLLMGADAVYGVSPLLLGHECVSMYDCSKNGQVERGEAKRTPLIIIAKYSTSKFSNCTTGPDHYASEN